MASRLSKGTPKASQYMPSEPTVRKEPVEDIPPIVKKSEFMRPKLHPTLQKQVKDMGCQIGLPAIKKNAVLNPFANWKKERG